MLPKSLSIGHSLLGVGLAWLILGMVIMPAGVSFNPGRAYQTSLVVLLYLPALFVSFSFGARAWRELWPQPLFRVFLVLLAWALLSLAWTQGAHPSSEVGRLASVLIFVVGWHAYAEDDARRISQLLLGAGLAVAACAAYYCISFIFVPMDDGRIIGQGTIATANYAAALMGVVALWLSQLELADRRWSVARYVGIAALLLFVGLTHTRGVWLALAVTIVAMPLWQPGRAHRWLAVVLALLAAAMLLRPTALLTERGTSLRPELFTQALHLIAQHPFRGLGQGAPITLMVNGAAYTHTHNLLTQVTVELGLPGLLLTVALWLMIAWQGWRHRRSLQGRVVLAIWVYASIVLQFDMPQMLDSPRPAWLLIWLPMALVLGMTCSDRLKSANSLH
ncbi:O-antigen ligase family protein [Dyella sp. C11]|uniref:O-antigen ligase family protein n=1 Tax=Dyella sp. C11 TaxID=2126991 RepID=UPI0018E5666A|nr:O-antigen ligase family protein [Dyella sp. C11]